jgi:hypothetical protein
MISPRSFQSTITKFSTGLAILLLAVILAFRTMIIFYESSDIAGVETNVIYTIIRFLDSGKLYTDPANLPFAITQYTPLYYYLCAGTAKIGGVNPLADIHSLYIIGRSWNLVFNLLTAYGIWRICRSVFRLPVPYGLMAAISAFTFMFPHNFTVRPDSLHDTLAVFTMYFFLLFIQAEKGGRAIRLLAVSVLFAVFACYAKQNGIQLILIILAYLVISRNWKMLVTFAGITLVVLAASLALLIKAYPFFIENVAGGVQNGVDLRDFYEYILSRKLFLLQTFPFIVASLLICMYYRSIFKNAEQERFLCLAVAGILAFATATALKKGSSLQYYYLFSGMSLILVFCYLGRLRQPEERSQAWIVRFTYLGLNLMMIAYASYIYQSCIAGQASPEIRRQEQSALKAANYLKDTLRIQPHEYVFANLSTDFTLPPRGMINNVLARNCVVPQLDIMNFSTEKLRVFGYDNLNKCLANGTIAYIIESKPKSQFHITEELPALERQHYRKLAVIDNYIIYKFENPGDYQE